MNLGRYNPPTLLTPPREEEEVYPYHRVWPSVGLQIGSLFALTFITYAGINFVGIDIPQSLVFVVNAAFALLPLLLWGFFSLLRERFVPEPRQRLLASCVISALAANAIGMPLFNALNIDVWLTLSDTFGRIVGYTVTLGVIGEIIKYFVIRFVVWPHFIRVRLDAVAYTVACGIGYSTVLNLHLIAQGQVSTDVIAAHVFNNTIIHIAASIMLAYGLVAVRFNRRSLFLMPSMLVLAALVHGVGIAGRASIINAPFVLGTAVTRSFFGLIFSAVLILAVLSIMIFLFANVERQAAEAALSGEG